MKTFMASQFDNWSLIWMFLNRWLNNETNRIHERAFRITFNYKPSSFSELLNKVNSVTIHHRKIKVLAMETYKVVQGLSTPLLNKVLHLWPSWNKFLERQRVKSVRYGTESITFLAPKIWELLSNKNKRLQLLKAKIKRSVLVDCPFRLC